MADKAPRCIVLGGINGAGKTTSARMILADTLKVMAFVNADVIAQGLSGFDPDAVNLEAGRIMLSRLHTLAEQRADFAFETTMSGRSSAHWLATLRTAGYFVQLHYFWLASADLAVQRVALRVKAGGHDIPEETVRRRYRQSIRNFLDLYRPTASEWRVYDNSVSVTTPRLIACGKDAETITVIDRDAWSQLEKEARR
jgi:predicted ABC-type ATPase